MQTLSGQLAYIEIALKHAVSNTTGHTQLQVKRSLEMFPLVRSAVQNLKASQSSIDAE